MKVTTSPQRTPPRKRMRAIAGLALFLGLLSLIFALPAWADHCFQDILNAND